MDSRSFTIGIICGVFFGALAVWLIAGNNGNEVFPVAESEAVATSVPDVASSARPIEQEPQELPDESFPEDGESQPSVVPTDEVVASWPENLRGELELEPKDDSWAYYMEQTLLQFLSAHPTIDQFDISSIECRTTKCQIEVFGFDESTVPVWQQVMYDIRQQPWSEFGQYGSSAGNIEGRLTIVGTFHRESKP